MQLFIVACILAACTAYALRRLIRRLTAPRDPEAGIRCAGCPLAGQCTHAPREARRSAGCGCGDKGAGCCHEGCEPAAGRPKGDSRKAAERNKKGRGAA